MIKIIGFALIIIAFLIIIVSICSRRQNFLILERSSGRILLFLIDVEVSILCFM